ncbi:[citrate (pro-3S)-lyase] ligase [Bradyrhizobium canariense]|uniref:[Citrate [pro-3S]-lyase] ligase n=1 Tax=Bradyrhizobium canariense TaxID=255045 RepID=A0ABX3WZU2_9BRAD|nr:MULTISPECIES: [citrate (pro-3S)-lyase] ligase [Bradyrhizobium]OSJ17157.1 [citrate (pro-3S)-lyase] ligase [Bradyrhizobium canariense]OSJ25046.1 [citrate (pro-3S)-lyase] ligase [Bradyrhizobium canariense]WOH61692.1 [citrate (pro-3S)-lyase] ligase [Bradyrhizobium sp. BWC-3-1]
MIVVDEFATIRPDDASDEMVKVRSLLAANHLGLDSQVEAFVVCRRDGRIVACAGLDHNVIKCVAVADEFRGESLSLRLGSEAVKLAAECGQFHLFLYSPPHNRPFFRGWGFYPLVEVPQLVVLMENSPIAIHAYCDRLRQQRRPGRKIGGIVLNANPFTLGHQYLVERAARVCDWLHVFVVREDASLFSYADRFRLVEAGVKHLERVSLHPGSEYIISRATFPGYFLKDRALVDHSWAAIDLLLFREYIAPALGISHRYVGTEPFDTVTETYNADMKHWLQYAASSAASVTVIEIPRASVRDVPISASQVRRLLARGEFPAMQDLVPAPTLQFLERTFSASRNVTKETERQ